MNGFEIFNFTLTEQPKLLNEILEFANKTKEEMQEKENDDEPKK